MEIPPAVKTLWDRWEERLKTPQGKRLTRIARGLFFLAVCLFLIQQLSQVGWRQIYEALPTQPLFYVFFLLLFFLLPITEIGIYRLSWPLDTSSSMVAFIKKQIYNKHVLGYSGEAFLVGWARQKFDLDQMEILRTVRDNNIISTAASTLITILVLLLALALGPPGALADAERRNFYFLGALSIFLLGVLPLMLLKRFAFSTPTRTAWRVLGLQMARLSLGQVLQIAQWWVVLPQVELRVWLTYAAASILLTRVPFIPSRDFVFLGLGVELSKTVSIPTAAVAGMLLVGTALGKLLSVGLFLALGLFREPPPKEAS